MAIARPGAMRLGCGLSMPTILPPRARKRPEPHALPALRKTNQFFAAPQEDTKDRLRDAVDSVLKKQSLSGQALIDDTQRPPVNLLLRAQGASPGRYWIEALPNN